MSKRPLVTISKKLKPRYPHRVRGLREPGFRSIETYSIADRFLRRGKSSAWRRWRHRKWLLHRRHRSWRRRSYRQKKCERGGPTGESGHGYLLVSSVCKPDDSGIRSGRPARTIGCAHRMHLSGGADWAVHCRMALTWRELACGGSQSGTRKLGKRRTDRKPLPTAAAGEYSSARFAVSPGVRIITACSFTVSRWTKSHGSYW